MSIRLVLDTRTATSHFPGIGRYTFNLARAMGSLLGENEWLILLRDPSQPSSWDVAALVGERVEVVEVPVSPFSFRQQWVIPRLLRRLGGDLYHSPYVLMPYRPGVPTVVTVYDLIPLLFPQIASSRARLLFRWAMTLALRTASHVIVISQATRRDLLAHFHLPSQRVSVIPLAADAQFHPQRSAQVAKVCQQYALPEDYVLYLGINKPHKNLTRLVEAWHLVVQSRERAGTGSTPSQLIIAGAWDEQYPECKQRVRDIGLTDRVRFLGFIPDEDLPALYSGAMLFLFPSLYEGFGLPVLEAMSCGAPVVCSNRSSLPEIVGSAALTFDPLDVVGMAEKIGEALHDGALRKEMVEKGLRQAAQFSWERTAQDTLRVYREVAGR